MRTRWVPFAGGGRRRGLDVKDGKITWAFLRQGDTRRRSIFLTKYVPSNSISVFPPIAKAKCLRTPVSGRYPVVVTPTSIGDATITANGVKLDIHVGAPKSLKIAFRNVINNPSGEDDDWSSDRFLWQGSDLLRAANAIFSYQGNIVLTPLGRMKRAMQEEDEYGMLPEGDLRAVRTRYKDPKAIRHFQPLADVNANVTVFFVMDYQSASSDGDAIACSWKNIILMELGMGYRKEAGVLCHELGHFMGLDHPGTDKDFNIMNKYSRLTGRYASSHRFKSRFDKEQILKMVSPCNWNNSTGYLCW